MRVRIQEDANRTEPEVVIYCAKADGMARRTEELIRDALQPERTIALSQNGTEYYLPLSRILFFETQGSRVAAHTASDMYDTPYKLYRLEESLPGYFLRISKSTIVNVNRVSAVTRNLAASSVLEFHSTYKQVYVSRRYFKLLKERLEEKRMQHE